MARTMKTARLIKKIAVEDLEAWIEVVEVGNKDCEVDLFLHALHMERSHVVALCAILSRRTAGGTERDRKARSAVFSHCKFIGDTVDILVDAIASSKIRSVAFSFCTFRRFNVTAGSTAATASGGAAAARAAGATAATAPPEMARDAAETENLNNLLQLDELILMKTSFDNFSSAHLFGALVTRAPYLRNLEISFDHNGSSLALLILREICSNSPRMRVEKLVVECHDLFSPCFALALIALLLRNVDKLRRLGLVLSRMNRAVAEAFAHFLPKCERLTKLVLAINEYNISTPCYNYYDAITTALPNLKALESLVLGGKWDFVCDRRGQRLFECILKLRTLQYFAWGNFYGCMPKCTYNQGEPRQVLMRIALAAGSKSLPLRRLCWDSHLLSRDVGLAVVRAALSSATLHDLSLQLMDSIDDVGNQIFNALLEAIARSPSLRRLNLLRLNLSLGRGGVPYVTLVEAISKSNLVACDLSPGKEMVESCFKDNYRMLFLGNYDHQGKNPVAESLMRRNITLMQCGVKLFGLCSLLRLGFGFGAGGDNCRQQTKRRRRLRGSTGFTTAQLALWQRGSYDGSGRALLYDVAMYLWREELKEDPSDKMQTTMHAFGDEQRYALFDEAMQRDILETAKTYHNLVDPESSDEARRLMLRGENFNFKHGRTKGVDVEKVLFTGYELYVHDIRTKK